MTATVSTSAGLLGSLFWPRPSRTSSSPPGTAGRSPSTPAPAPIPPSAVPASPAAFLPVKGDGRVLLTG